MKLSDKRNFATEGADPPPAGPATGFSRLERAQHRRAIRQGRRSLGDPVLRRPPSGGAGYPEGKKTERSEGPESLRYIARSQATIRAVQIGGARAFDAHLSNDSRDAGRPRGGLPHRP